MLQVNARDMNGLPFEGLRVISELLNFNEEAMLNHCQDDRDNDWLCYWVDFDNTGKRWLYGKINKEELYLYLIGSKSLKQTFSDISSDYVFLVDYNVDEEIGSVKIINSFSIPETYFAGQNSFYKWGLSEYYSKYLDSFIYIDKLRQKSYIVTVKPTNQIHGSTVGAREAAFVLSNFTKSIEGYIDVTAFNIIKNRTNDRSRINKEVNRIKERLSPRIAQNVFHSFEVWLSMDVVTLEVDSPQEIEWRNHLIENYKNDILDVDVSSEEDGRIIAEKYSPEERKKIFDPLVKVYENEEINITISDFNQTFKRDFSRKPITQSFKDIVIPTPTIEELEAKNQKKLRIITAVIALEEGEDISKIKKSKLKQNLLFTEENEINNFPINSPIIIGNRTILLKKPLRCVLSVDDQNTFNLSNARLELNAESKELPNAINDIKAQFAALVSIYERNKDVAGSRFEELKTLLV